MRFVPVQQHFVQQKLSLRSPDVPNVMLRNTLSVREKNTVQALFEAAAVMWSLKRLRPGPPGCDSQRWRAVNKEK
jgi:hypothetical protein